MCLSNGAQANGIVLFTSNFHLFQTNISSRLLSNNTQIPLGCSRVLSVRLYLSILSLGRQEVFPNEYVDRLSEKNHCDCNFSLFT